MQRSDLQPYEKIPLLNDLDDAERGIVIAGNNKSLLMRLEECIFALKIQDELHNVEKNHKLSLSFHCAASILILMTPAIIETIIILTTLGIPNTAFTSKQQQTDYHNDSFFCIYDGYGCTYTNCGDYYPINNFNDPWPYAHPTGNRYSLLGACYSWYREIVGDAFFYRTIIIAATSCVNSIISLVLLIAMFSTAPQRQRLFSDRTTLAMLPKKIQDEINDLATKTSTVITDSHNINEIIQALHPALEERQQARQRRAFLSGALDKHEDKPLYRFFHGRTVDGQYIPGDGGKLATELIFEYAGLLKPTKHP